MYRLLTILMFVFYVGLVSAQPRHALVIGNGSYKTAPLTNPVNDARDIARTLRKIGFDVIEKKNVNRKQMRGAVRKFKDKIKNGGVGLFYFAGHGVQVNGINYLVPIGADMSQEYEVSTDKLALLAV